MSYDEEKFKEFNRILREVKADLIVINHPEVLGDDYEEMVENLNRLAGSGMHLAILPLGARGQADDLSAQLPRAEKE